MIRETICTILWAAVTLLAACIVWGGVVGLLASRIRMWLGNINEKTPLVVKLAYSFLPMVPLLAAGACLLLCVFGKLPGTKGKSAS